MMFSPEGHIDVAPGQLLQLARRDPRRLVNDFLLVGTPRAFQTHADYCRFRNAVAEKLQLHPNTIVVRGSARLGYSISPRAGKAWRKFHAKSDIDVAVVDVDYFLRMDNEIRLWESRQRLPHYKARAYQPYLMRQQYRSFNCIADQWLPRNTCVPHSDAMEGFDTTPFCCARRTVSAFVFRDWWSLRNRCEHDLDDLCKAVDNQIIGPPDDV